MNHGQQPLAGILIQLLQPEMGENPVPYYFGFAGDSGAVGTMTVTSFEYIPYEE